MKQGDSRADVAQAHRQIDHAVLFLKDGPPAAEVDSMAVLPQDLLIRVHGPRLHQQGTQPGEQPVLGDTGRAVR